MFANPVTGNCFTYQIQGPVDFSPSSTVLKHLVTEELQELDENFFLVLLNILLSLLQKYFNHTIKNFSTGSAGDC